jgi:hypothetical protein
VHGLEHAPHPERIGVIVGVAEVRHRTHPVEIRTGAKRRPRAATTTIACRERLPISAKAAEISAIRASFEGRCGIPGRLSQILRTAPRCSTSRCWYAAMNYIRKTPKRVSGIG